MNAFLIGAKKVNANLKLRSVTIDSWDSEFFQTQATDYLYEQGCPIIAQHTDGFYPQEVFVDGGRVAIGSNYDSRQVLGE
jgi:basic membrane lipoprotein Med (substrate-binding protein (PBP1-ABC) superfamily)